MSPEDSAMEWNVGGFDRLERIAHGIIFLLIALFLIGASGDT